MPSPSLPRTRIIFGLVAASVLLGSAGGANASHFRASVSGLTISGDQATWTVVSAWRSGSVESFGGGIGSPVAVSQLASSAAAPGSGSSTGVNLTVASDVQDLSNPLYGVTTEVVSGSVATLGDGVYEMYLSSSARVGGVGNAGSGAFSQWVRFTKSGSSYDVSPVFNDPSLYEILPLNGEVVLDYSATDPEGGAVSYALVSSTSGPYYGASALPCSTFVAGELRIGPAQCTGGAVYSTLFPAGSYWAVKVSASDAAGNQVVTDTLLRVMTAPQPSISSHTYIGNGSSADLNVLAPDTTVATWSVACTNNADAADVVTGTGTSSPVRVSSLKAGATYSCKVTATNAAGSGTSGNYTLGPIVLSGVQLLLDLEVGDTLSGAQAFLAGGGLQANSPYTLVQHSTPVTLHSGTANGSGAFTHSLALPTSACVAGAHSLTLTGTAAGGAATSATAWYVLSSTCVVLKLSFVGVVTADLPATGAAVDLRVPIGAVVTVIIGLALSITTRRARQRL